MRCEATGGGLPTKGVYGYGEGKETEGAACVALPLCFYYVLGYPLPPSLDTLHLETFLVSDKSPKHLRVKGIYHETLSLSYEIAKLRVIRLMLSAILSPIC
ncbi:hypothetical protein V1478_005989 [Vespula squamosa]|uniref:Uncharacterized protein n=1 Tax=Vespula squamosa TaxID=30214 RepID=A0ABD2B8Y8_VESSQ